MKISSKYYNHVIILLSQSILKAKIYTRIVTFGVDVKSEH
jgi:hypothetical protein